MLNIEAELVYGNQRLLGYRRSEPALYGKLNHVCILFKLPGKELWDPVLKS